MKFNNFLKNWFLFCSGAHVEILNEKDCQYEYNKYIGIGSAVFFTALFAFISSAYAMFFIFDDSIKAVLIGFIWGCFIFSLDRYIVATLKKEDDKWLEVKNASPRIILAILLALIISKPLELKIFEKEIANELIEMQSEVERSQNESIIKKYPQLIIVKDQYDKIDNDYKQCINTYNYLMLEAQKEADGSGGTGNRGVGSIFELKNMNANKKQKECDEIKVQLNEAQNNLSTMHSKIDLEINNLNRVAQNGLLARIEALDRLGYNTELVEKPSAGLNSIGNTKVDSSTHQSNEVITSKVEFEEVKERNSMYYASLAITLLFIVIELAPLLLKIVSNKGNYDIRIRTIEEAFISKEVETISKLNDEVNTRIKINVGLNENVVNQELRDNRRLLDQISNAQLSLTKEIVGIWEDDQLNKIRANPSKYIGNIVDGTNNLKEV